MRAFHDSRDLAYRTPYGVATVGEPVVLRLDVWDAPGAKVQLRTWTGAEGERLYPTSPDAPPSSSDEPACYRAEYVPGAQGVVWYQFVITDAAGEERRYGAREGCFGGAGELYDREPPSFELTAIAADLDVKQLAAMRNRMNQEFSGLITGALSSDKPARALYEAVEALRENYPHEGFNRTFDLLRAEDPARLIARLADAEVSEDGPVRPLADYHLDDWRLGRAKTRLWLWSLAQMLGAGPAPSYIEYADPEGGAGQEVPLDPCDPRSFPWAAEDGDFAAIVGDSAELRSALSLFTDGAFECYAASDDVFGFWRRGDDGTGVCVLLNLSVYREHDVLVPLQNDESVAEIIEGYGVPVVDTADVENREGCQRADRYARVRLRQLGSAVLYVYSAPCLEKPLQPGLGVLAHLTSLPLQKDEEARETHAEGASPVGADAPSGALGAPAREFVDWLARAGVRYWQVLPVNPVDSFGSPYAGLSAFAGNTRLLDPDAEMGSEDDYRAFCEREAGWLDAYAAFMAIRRKVGENVDWQDWPEAWRSYDPSIIEGHDDLAAYADEERRRQFAFDSQWHAMRAYANERGVQIIGDMPIYVSTNSADVWANPHIFQLDDDGHPARIAGCPPDAFSEEGQVWGNPVYDWDVLRADGYAWWLRRLQRALELYDYVRLDHFIGFSRYFSIPAGKKAKEGVYRPGPGLEFFQKAYEEFGPLPIIAEDLGLIKPCVRALTAACGFSGMDIVQFVDGNDPLSGYSPRPGKIAYTGTHDNQTLVGYVKMRYPDIDAQVAARELMDKVVACHAPVVVLPLQDLMGLGDEARMNVPGVAGGNWTWRAEPDDVARALGYTKNLVKLHERPR